ncbi:MAG: hypothetical protein ACR2IQ_02895 [Minisyncoccia bacterium]
MLQYNNKHMGYFARLKQKPPEVQSRYALVWASIIFIGVLVLWFGNMSFPDAGTLIPKDESLKVKLHGVTSSITNEWNSAIDKEK